MLALANLIYVMLASAYLGAGSSRFKQIANVFRTHDWGERQEMSPAEITDVRGAQNRGSFSK